ncbi:tetratricopeptide repeat protein [Thiomicrorhabdus sp. zzn3]|uniref:tetratricopeptide repeat protein n=1 Tax=Thiomicrorhabdus sp. zzn3 TaxID=3039775 RepID=UPI0024371BA6|nr:tetratricopeptide repeat protein [Thiomicrorhabdus sp. zzn3]MDG6778576.1 tetratricopeptide repeat protein [Thiomicrorhabdus sp. zzn3]
MSVLLEALKKAAENKKQNEAADESVRVATEAAIEPDNKQESGIAFNFQDQENNSDVATQLKDELDKNYSESKKEHDSENKSSLQLAEEDLLTNEADLPSLSIDDLEAIDAVSPLENRGEYPQAEESVKKSHEVFVSNEAEDVVGAGESPSDITENADLEESSDESENSKSGINDISSAHQGRNDQNESQEDQSYEWSLSQLPGYKEADKRPMSASATPNISDKVELEETPQNNAILTTNQRFKSSLTKSIRNVFFGRSSTFLLYSFLSLFVLTLLSLFSLLYFQDQNNKLEQSMRKYEIVRAPLELAKPAVEKKEEVEVATLDRSEVGDAEEKGKDTVESAGSDGAQESQNIEISHIVKEQEDVGSKTIENNKTEPTPPSKTIRKPVVTPVSVTSGMLEVKSSVGQSSLNLAYDALYAQNYPLAKQKFEEVLAVNDESVEAWNGLGAVYAQQGDVERAIQQYYKALEIAPDNLHAFEAVVALNSGSLSGEQWKREIKRVLSKHPQSAILNYALGNIYAQETDWEKAQAYFFQAYSLDDSNSDYLVNLAISLDRLGKYVLAEKYYTLALVHANTQSVSFDSEQIKLRLATIKQFLGQKEL